MRRLVILRPEPGATETLARARELGLEGVTLPIFRIDPLDWIAPDPSQFDALLLTSANAVRHAGDQLEQLRRLPVHAVGEATSRAARNAGLDVATTGNSDVLGLLESIAPGARLLHLCGQHRRLPTDTFQSITSIPVYRSVPVRPVGSLETAEGGVVAVHSPRAAGYFAELADETGLDRSSIRIAAISDASAVAAGKGWQRVESALEPNDRSLLALAAQLCDKDGQE